VFLISPSLILALVIASIYAVLYNLWRGGAPRELLFYLVAAWVGFGLGQIAGWLISLNWLMIGRVHVLEGTLLCWGLLFLVNWLRIPDKERAQTTASN
jgi:hypothetical protein